MPAPVTVGVSLKMYFGHADTLAWLDRVAALVRSPGTVGDAVRDGAVELFVVPGYLAIPSALGAFTGIPVLVGAQDLATEDAGAYTGEVSGAELAEIGVRVAEVGHAERRHLYGDTDAIVAAKTMAALRNGLTPVLCVGESEQTGAQSAITACLEQLRSALRDAAPGRVIVAYEPVWAIGAAVPASPEHARAVCHAIRAELDGHPGRPGSSIIYGGSAGPGTLSSLAPDVDGLFLGRFAHDPSALATVLAEAAEQAALRAA
ncbi:MAG TPA: triose-phosphate isomerase family protein [Pseudolysinimonas sp.]|jgi:triosephosphate isomerase